MDKIKHVVVLMFENRSYDYLFGFLDHPDKDELEGLTGNEKNPVSNANSRTIGVLNNARPNIYPDPGHSHKDVMEQLFFTDPNLLNNQPKNLGFGWNYRKKINSTKRKNRKFFKKFFKWIEGLFSKKEFKYNDQAAILGCLDHPGKPSYHGSVMATLAKEFAVCDHYHCSVPGETWPNRNFAHAGTSDGQVDIKIKFYKNKTIFQQLAEENKTWNIYHDGIAQSMAFSELFFTKNGGFRKMKKFYEDIENDQLPHYSFIEPRQIKLFASYTNSMHPGNNPIDESDFKNGEKLVSNIYKKFLENKKVFNKTLFMITFDEHGGFYDHVPPPRNKKKFTVKEKYSKNGYKFNFDLLGPRVPTILISPRIKKAAIDHTLYDHTSIIATVREIFKLKSTPLSNREKNANTFSHLLMNRARRINAMPDFKGSSSRRMMQPKKIKTPKNVEMVMNEYELSLVGLVENLEHLSARMIRTRSLSADDSVDQAELEVKDVEITKYKSMKVLSAHINSIVRDLELLHGDNS